MKLVFTFAIVSLGFLATSVSGQSVKATVPLEEIGDIKADRFYSRRSRVVVFLYERLSTGTNRLHGCVRSTAEEDSKAEVFLDVKYGLVRSYEDSGDFKEALVRYRELLELIRTASTKSAIVSEGEVLARTGNIYRLLSRYEAAIEHLLLAAVRFRDQQDSGDEAEAMTKVADIFLWLQDFGTASSYYDKALAIFTRNKEMQFNKFGYWRRWRKQRDEIQKAQPGVWINTSRKPPIYKNYWKRIIKTSWLSFGENGATR